LEAAALGAALRVGAAGFAGVDFFFAVAMVFPSE
jgi:hypothetical protein